MNNKINTIHQLAYFDIAVRDDYAWFCNYFHAAIYRMNLRSHKINVEAFIPEQVIGVSDLYGPIALYKNTLILAPRNSNKIVLYNLSQKTFKTIPISMNVMEMNLKYKLFMEIAVIGDMVYLLPCRYPAIIKLNMNTLQITYYDNWYRELKKNLNEPNRFIFGRPAIQNEHECLFPIWQDNLLMQFNLKTSEYSLHRIFNKGTCFSSVAFDGENYWIASRNKNLILKWEEKKHVIVFDNFPENFRMGTNGRFVSLECIGNEVIAVPQFGSGNMIIAVNCQTGAIRKIKDILTNPIYDLKENALGQGLILCSKKINENRMIVFSDFDGKTIDINLESGEIIEFDTILEGKAYASCMQQALSSSLERMYLENSVLSLKTYVKYLEPYTHTHKNAKTSKIIGKKIYDILIAKIDR